MKTLKKIGAFALAAIMLLAISATAFAAETDISDGGITSNGDRDTDTFVALDNSVSINKGIVFINDDPTAVYEPNITYTYTITAAEVTDGAITVTDDHEATPEHKAVVYDDYTLNDVVPTQTATVTFGDGNAFVAATADGSEITKAFSFTFVPTAFPHAGIFRFLITESVDANARETAGIVSNPTYAAARYLDVYVRNGASALEIYGYVLFEAASADQDITGTSTKSNGWVNTASSGAPADVDVYTTYNAYIQKHVSGSLADQTNAFPFEITLANTAAQARTTKIRVQATDAKAVVGDGTTTWTGTDSAQASNAYIALNGSTDVVLGSATKNTIKHGGEIGLFGIPADTTITVEETNNTYDVYTASATVTDGTGTASAKQIIFKADGTGEYAAAADSAALSRNGLAKLGAAETFAAKKIIDFTNTLTEISPTGVVLRVAPYVLILAAGVVLLVLSKNRRHAED